MLGKAKSFRLSLKGGRGAVVTFRKSNKRGGLFFSGKAWKERFSFREKHIRDGFNVTFSLVRKSNQKVPQRAAKRRCKIAPSGLPESGSKLCTGIFFIEIEAVRHENSFQALNRCERVILLRKDLRVFIKRQILIWVDSRLRGIKRESSVGGGFYGNRLQLFGKERVWREKCKKFQFLHTIIFWINLKVCISSHHFLCHAKP